MATLPDNGLNSKMLSNEAVKAECDSVETTLAEVKAAYEQYFLGMERRPPAPQHQALKQRIRRLKGAFVRQTALKFRINTLHSKLLTYERLWARSIDQIERGTYKRDLFKAKRRAAFQPNAPVKEQEARPEAAAEAPAATDRQPAAPAASAAARGRVSPPPSAGLSEKHLRSVYDAYVQAKRRCQEDVSRLSYESVAASLRKQVPALMTKSKASRVDFKVVIKDGKAVLRAIPRTE